MGAWPARQGGEEGMNQAVTLRQAVAAGAAAIRALTRAAYAKWVPLIGRVPKSFGEPTDE